MIRRRTFLLGTAAISGSVFLPSVEPKAAADEVENFLTLTDASGEGAHDYPLRIGRPFVRGEIVGVPQVVVNGTPMLTQADVKMRWPDGSVRHAILSFVVPSIPSHGRVRVEFVDAQQPENAPIGRDQMLEPAFDFDAVVELTRNGQTQTVSARSMLRSGDVTVWCGGPVATTIVIADHSSARKYDFGFEPTRPVRPIFHATFWPSLRKVQVRVIGENCCTEAMQDVAYSLLLKVGMKTPAEVYRQDAVQHSAGTRWTRSFWIGGTPNAEIDIDHNLSYLAETLAFPNFDSTLRVPEESIREWATKWEAAPKNLYERGLWTRNMPDPGGRTDIGPYTLQTTLWLFTGDHRLFEIVSKQADLAGAWPMHVREGNSAKRFDNTGKIPALGRPISVFARPSLWLFDPRDESSPADRIEIHGERIMTDTFPKIDGGWQRDGAHQPDPYSALFTLTGDYFALEQLQLWAAASVFLYPPAYRGSGGTGGAIWDEIRGDAWVFRSRVQAAYLSPDRTPEKNYFTQKIEDAIASWEGSHDIHGTRFEGSALWNLAREQRLFVSPLHFFHENSWADRMRDMGGLIAARTGSAEQLWQHFYLIFELGQATEKGFPSGALLSWTGQLLLQQFREPDTYSPYNLMRVAAPVRDKTGAFYRTWTETLSAYSDPTPPKVRLDYQFDENYASYPYAASTVLTREPGGLEAYAWLREKFYEPYRDRYARRPKWAFIPRS